MIITINIIDKLMIHCMHDIVQKYIYYKTDYKISMRFKELTKQCSVINLLHTRNFKNKEH